MTDEHGTGDLLRDAVRDVFSRITEQAATTALDAVARCSLWRELAEGGWLAMFVAESSDGGAGGAEELVLVGEEAGRCLLPVAFLENAVLAPWILRSTPPENVQNLTRQLVAGEVTFALACDVAGPRPSAPRGVRAERDAAGWKLEGKVELLPEIAGADLLVVAAEDSEGRELVMIVDGSAPELDRRELHAVDTSRRLGNVEFRKVPVADDAVLAVGREASQLLEEMWKVGALYTAAEALGMARVLLARSVEYATVRHQFGKPIGSFQGIAHPLADLYVDVEHTAVLVAEAARALDRRDDDHAATVSMAKACAGTLAITAARKAVQVHGGIGFTWELGLHVFLKRALLGEQLFGSGDWHARRVFEHLDQSRSQKPPMATEVPA